MWVAKSGGVEGLAPDKFWNEHTRAFAEENGGADVGGYYVMKTAQGTIQMGWAPSQGDLCAEDWVVVV